MLMNLREDKPYEKPKGRVDMHGNLWTKNQALNDKGYVYAVSPVSTPTTPQMEWGKEATHKLQVIAISPSPR